MSFFNKLNIYLKSITLIYKYWGIINVFKLKITPLFIHYFINRQKGDRLDLEHKALYNYLKEELKGVIQRYRNIEESNESIGKVAPLWVLWWQGEQQMPELVRYCIFALKKNSQEHPVIILTKDNYTDYVNLPQFINKLFENGNITIAHFSDIIRAYLLSHHGGVWIDSTYWVLNPIDISRQHIFMIKDGKTNSPFVARGRWCGNLLGGTSKTLLFNFIYDSFCVYWKHNVHLIDYFFIDYLIDIAHQEFSWAKHDIDDITNVCPDSTSFNINEVYDVEDMDRLRRNNDFIKLSWKKKYYKTDLNGNLTYYGYLSELTK